jgi:hypothetical protein
MRVSWICACLAVVIAFATANIWAWVAAFHDMNLGIGVTPWIMFPVNVIFGLLTIGVLAFMAEQWWDIR